MFKRKIKASFYTTLLLTMGYAVLCTALIPVYIFKMGLTIFEAFVAFGVLPFVFTYALIGNFLYGLPASIIAEYITKKAKKGQLLFSFFLHVLFALITVIFLEEVTIYIVISSILFFLIDIRLKSNQNNLFQKPTFAK